MNIPWHLGDLEKWILIIGDEEICYLYGSREELDKILGSGRAHELGIPQEYTGEAYKLVAEI